MLTMIQFSFLAALICSAPHMPPKIGAFFSVLFALLAVIFISASAVR